MFARTARLMLRPGWPEDAKALTRAIGHASVVTKLTRAPWPYALGDAQTFLARPRGPEAVDVLIFDDPGGAPRLVGGIAIDRTAQGDSGEFGYWLTPAAWGRGYATEAGRAMLDIARALGMTQLQSGHFIDNPASGRVLAKLGFSPVGRAPRHSIARGHEAECELLALDLTTDGALRLAA